MCGCLTTRQARHALKPTVSQPPVGFRTAARIYPASNRAFPDSRGVKTVIGATRTGVASTPYGVGDKVDGSPTAHTSVTGARLAQTNDLPGLSADFARLIATPRHPSCV